MATGRASVIGDTGFRDLWGLGYWKNEVYGFSKAAEVVLIDPATGFGAKLVGGVEQWWGGGVNTAAPR